jgi:hypothetical protein
MNRESHGCYSSYRDEGRCLCRVWCPIGDNVHRSTAGFNRRPVPGTPVLDARYGYLMKVPSRSSE